MAKKRAGRKPRGESAMGSLTIRIRHEMRQRLQDAADARGKRKYGWNLSQEILMRLNWSMEKENLESRSMDLKALNGFVDVLSQYAGVYYLDDSQYSWRSNPYLFEAFRRAIGYLMIPMRPAGEIVPPPSEPAPSTPTESETQDNPYLSAAREAASEFLFKFPDSVDEYAKDLAHSVIDRARMELAYEDSRDPAKKRILTIDGEEVELMDGDEQWMRMNWTLADAARQLLKGGK
jgi:hypothetical protein